MTPLDELAHLAGMTPRTGYRADWARVREALGFDVPADYRELIDRYGPGLLDGYVNILGPDPALGTYDLGSYGRYMDDHYKRNWARRPDAVPPELRNREVTIIEWAATEDAAHFYWLAEPGVAPEQWRLAIVDETDAWEFHRLGSVEILLQFVTGELDTDAIPEAGFAREITYQRFLRDVDG